MAGTNAKREDRAALESQLAELDRAYADWKSRKLSLDMTRGKPCSEQLDLANGLLDCVSGKEFNVGGVDTRNYGGLDGLPEAKRLFAPLLDAGEDEVIIGGNSSLNLMFDTVSRGMTHGMPGGEGPWMKRGTVKWICPAPGYDRHFSICQHFGIEMLAVEMRGDGPDMDAVERLAASDAAVKGMWLVPKYGNPTGVTCSDEVVDRLARMKTAASDFRLFWDNAYAIHHLTDTPDRLKNILAACREAGNPDRPLLFGSTSKVSFAGAGISLMGGSAANLDAARRHLSMQTIGPDKVNQLRHVRFFRDWAGVEAHMRKHAALIKPKFDAVLEILDRELGGKGLAAWSRPNGGYFISLDVEDGCAAAVVCMAGEAGVKLTAAGATFPLQKDPRDRNIRIAPTLPALDEIRRATELLALCVERAVVRKRRGL